MRQRRLAEKNGKTECKPMYPKKLPYGEEFVPGNGLRYVCRADTIIEVELVVNGGGHLTYKFK